MRLKYTFNIFNNYKFLKNNNTIFLASCGIRKKIKNINLKTTVTNQINFFQ